jgi:hypothetical protein
MSNCDCMWLGNNLSGGVKTKYTKSLAAGIWVPMRLLCHKLSFRKVLKTWKYSPFQHWQQNFTTEYKYRSCRRKSSWWVSIPTCIRPRHLMCFWSFLTAVTLWLRERVMSCEWDGRKWKSLLEETMVTSTSTDSRAKQKKKSLLNPGLKQMKLFWRSWRSCLASI